MKRGDRFQVRTDIERGDESVPDMRGMVGTVNRVSPDGYIVATMKNGWLVDVDIDIAIPLEQDR